MSSPADFTAGIGQENQRLYVRHADREWHIAELKRSGRVSNHVCEMLRRDRTRFWVSDSTTLAGDTILGTMVDVTDLVQSQRAFREAEVHATGASSITPSRASISARSRAA